MKAIVLAGGKGTRLRPLTCHLSKPMLPILEKPVLHYLVETLLHNGIDKIALTVEHNATAIKEYFQDGEEYGLAVEYFEEESPQGTAGAIRYAKSFCEDTFFVMSGDVVTDVDLKNAFRFHRAHGGIATIFAKEVANPEEYGVLTVGDNQIITSFEEKPRDMKRENALVNTGMYIFNSEILKYLDDNNTKDISRDLIPKLLKSEEKIFAYEFSEYWIDIGDVIQYRQVHEDILLKKVNVNVLGKWNEQKQIWKGEDVWIEEGADIEGPVYIGSSAIIRTGARIEPFSVIGHRTEVQPNASVKRCIIWHNSYIGRNSELRGAIIAEKNVLIDNVSVFEDSIIGSSNTVGRNVIIKPGVKVWPLKNIHNDCVLGRTLYWGGHQPAALFSSHSISGKANVTIKPELIVALSCAYNDILQLGDEIVVGADGHSYSELLKEIFINTVRSGGNNVLEVRGIQIPIFCIAIASRKRSKCGVFFQMRGEDVFISCFDQNGEPINSKAQYELERAITHRSFNHLPIEKIGKYHRMERSSQLFSLHRMKLDKRFFIYEKPCYLSAWENVKNKLIVEGNFEVVRYEDAISIKFEPHGWIYITYLESKQLVIIYSDMKIPLIFIDYVNEKINQYQRV
ncbi:sugar phosphate nucleotidyltransferase [Bacillus solimangrovi]|uniref:Nucleotidyl transferase n=1 Tax=Bacillus solimangrovi TaxID=1305675 RepID=A0A1E5LFR8_9BACI|nr:sugar phosphate nucleotidyltransferase [Bacillus solimangrovi]OEH92910.1 hypothetical protein BFG57_14650 [Bacillus solimangrovi]